LGMSSASNTTTLTVGAAKPTVYTDTTSISSDGFPGNYSLTASLTTVPSLRGSSNGTCMGSSSFLSMGRARHSSHRNRGSLRTILGASPFMLSEPNCPALVRYQNAHSAHRSEIQ
jgi:hypothetical protein